MGADRTLRLGVLQGKLGNLQAQSILKSLKRRTKGFVWDVLAFPVKAPRRGKSPHSGQIPIREFYSESLHEAMLSNKIDVAVHRMKDFPPFLPEGVHIAAVLERKTPLDVFVSRDHRILDELPAGARVCVSSLRRKAQLQQYRSDLEITYCLGDVEERLAHLDAGDMEGLVLAAAGMEWLGLQDRVSEIFTIDISVPAAGQGALGLMARTGDKETIESIAVLNDSLSRKENKAERAFLRTLEAWPGAPVGALGCIKGDILRLEAVICSSDGENILRLGMDGSPDDPEWVGDHLGRQMLRELGREILDVARKEL
ncbi:MAG: hydroxymethylbilane synthase [Candidatus Eisenbacteria bacterium]|uniref:Hydroxymethylbilane synthase n=1 Tax=Eiseniibacteriota bacterium TaxID=2212470 RepID=A0A948RTF8_UNCEI|nr:hydroxymethylbilane synthase [Candidatus Eisenbacteria bacterium]MBU1949270.1 hydroxymethylbilane synthase [Candidatus Eisenbacteria bacterium]MBU2689686.1 hydroxymethylbilane synthase [Candidatus Eisenbacteria bacterium]